MRPIPVLFPLCLAASLARAADPVPSGEFTKIQLTDEFWAEGITCGDFNHDGKMDVAYGPHVWDGPDFKNRHTIYPDDKRSKSKKADGTEVEFGGFKGALGTDNDYSDDFLSFSHDFNGDGWTDVLVIGYPGKEAFWFENPKGVDKLWEKHQAWSSVDNESPALVDLLGTGNPVLLCNSGGCFGYAKPDPANPNAEWTWHAISPKGPWQRFTHGIGAGDVNGDGKADILDAGGWWEQPPSLEGDPVWKRHEADFGKGGAQMYACDVNGDGKADVITCLDAHGYGLVWFEQTNEGGAQGWTKHLIVGQTAEENPQGVHFSQPHAIWLQDMNGDGLPDIVTGKRFWAHGPKGDPEPNATPFLYWFELKREGGKASYTAHMIDDASGVGTEITATDMNGDGKPDVLVGNKKGAFVFLRSPAARMTPVSLSDGKTFTGWEGDIGHTWKLEDGAFTAGDLEHKQPYNDFLATTKSYGDFELNLDVRIAGSEGFVNGGIQFWSERIKDSHEVRGFQADFGSGYDGALCDESRRSGRDIVRPSKEVHDQALKKDEWNHYRIRAEWPHIQLWLNGIKTIDYIEKDPSIPRQGIFALQIHGGAKTKIWYRNPMLQEL